MAQTSGASQPSHILWQNEDQSIILLDGPRSIAEAQCLDSSYPTYEMLSCEPLQRPFPSLEPKSPAARRKLHQTHTDDEVHLMYQDIVRGALDTTRDNHTGPWHLPRWFEDTAQTTGKRKATKMLNEGDAHFPASLDFSPATFVGKPIKVGMVTQSSDGEQDTLVGIELPFVSNNHHAPARLEINSPTPQTFILPPLSTFMLANCASRRQITLYHDYIRNQAEEAETRRHFDFILLDPPWPNASVSRKRNSYKTPRLAEVVDMIHLMDIDRIMADGCLVGIWITNKPAVRDAVLGDDGIFASWGVELAEEWIWVKTTSGGEPIVELNSTWRRPYEVLLLGRRTKYASAMNAPESVKRRVIFSVPDLHSRKPCLKHLIGSLMLNARDYRALEVFARTLIAGWWSWGDECIKFNSEGFWRQIPLKTEPDSQSCIETGETAV